MTYRDRIRLIEKLAVAAQAASEKWGVPASVMLAQALFANPSATGRQTHNWFGGKLSFASAAECFDHHARAIASSEQYVPAMNVAGDAVLFAQRLQDCGYSTEAGYGLRLADLILRYDLARKYDKPKEKNS